MRIDEYREKKRLSQKRFGEMLEPLAPQSLVSQWEVGTTRITLSYALDIQRKTDNEVTPEDCESMYVGPPARKKAEQVLETSA